MHQPKKKLLVLDIDETLIYATREPLSREADFRVGPYFAFKRPHLDNFLATCLTWFEVGIWTSSSPLYAAEVVSALFEGEKMIAFLWASDRCTMAFDCELGEHYSKKNLNKLKKKGYNLEAVIVVDDSPEKHRQNYGNLVRVKPYNGEEDDDELLKLLPYLDSLRQAENIRAVEKRLRRSHLHHQHNENL